MPFGLLGNVDIDADEKREKPGSMVKSFQKETVLLLLATNFSLSIIIIVIFYNNNMDYYYNNMVIS